MAPLSLRLRVIWTRPNPANPPGAPQHPSEHGTGTIGGTLFGMQRGRWEVLPGSQQPDGTTVFETTVEPYTDKAGRQRFRGACVQGPPDEPFLYLSWRPADTQAWIMRAKVLLTPLTPEMLLTLPEGATLETTISQMGHRPPGHMQKWAPI